MASPLDKLRTAFEDLTAEKESELQALQSQINASMLRLREFEEQETKLLAQVNALRAQITELDAQIASANAAVQKIRAEAHAEATAITAPAHQQAAEIATKAEQHVKAMRSLGVNAAITRAPPVASTSLPSGFKALALGTGL